MLLQKSILRALPNKVIFLICDNLISSENKLSELVDNLSFI